MARYKATWQRKKLFADGQLLSYRMREFGDLVQGALVLSPADVERVEEDLKAFMGDVNDWRADIKAEIASRVGAVAA